MNKKNSIHSLCFLKFKKTLSVYFLIAFLLSSMFSYSQTSSHNYKFGATFLSDAEYAKLPKANWDSLQTRSNVRGIAMKNVSSGITMLNNLSSWMYKR